MHRSALAFCNYDAAAAVNGEQSGCVDADFCAGIFVSIAVMRKLFGCQPACGLCVALNTKYPMVLLSDPLRCSIGDPLAATKKFEGMAELDSGSLG